MRRQWKTLHIALIKTIRFSFRFIWHQKLNAQMTHLKTGDMARLVVDGQTIFARKMPHDAAGYDLGVDPHIYTIPVTVSVHETSLQGENRRDVSGLDINSRGSFHRFKICLPNLEHEQLWLTRPAHGGIAVMGTMSTRQSWAIVSMAKNASSPHQRLGFSDAFMLKDDTVDAYLYLNAHGVLSTTEHPWEHPRWTRGFMMSLSSLDDPHSEMDSDDRSTLLELKRRPRRKVVGSLSSPTSTTTTAEARPSLAQNNAATGEGQMTGRERFLVALGAGVLLTILIVSFVKSSSS